MAAVRKFLFDRSFDIAEPEPDAAAEATDAAGSVAEPEPPPPPTFTEEELAAARDEAFQQGREQGIREAAEGLDKAILDTLATAGERLADVLQDQANVEADARDDAVKVGLAVARKLFPDLNEKSGLGEIERVVAQAMALVLGEATLLIRVNNQLVDPLKTRLETLKTRVMFRGEIALEGRDDIPPGDCRIDWANGGATRDTAAIWQAIDNVLERNGLAEIALPTESADGSTTTPATETPLDAPAGTDGADAETDQIRADGGKVI